MSKTVESSPIVPDFDQRSSHGLARAIQDATADPRDRTDGRRNGIVDDDQIVIRIHRHFVRIVRPFGLRRRENQLIGERATYSEEDTAEPDSRDESAPGQMQIRIPDEVLFLQAISNVGCP